MSGFFPHNLHIREKIQLALRGQKIKCLPQLLLLRVHVHQQTPGAGERMLHTWATAPREAVYSPQSPVSVWQMLRGWGSDQILASPVPVLLEELKFLCLWADNISGPRAGGYKVIFLLLQREAK